MGGDDDGDRVAVIGGHQRARGDHLVRAAAAEISVEAQDLLCLAHRVDDHAGEHWADGMKLILE